MDMALKSACAALGAVLTFLTGTPDALFYTLVTLLALDYLSGVLAAAHNRCLDARTGWRGIAKKIVTLFVVMLAASVDRLALGQSGALRGAVIAFFIANEGLSLLENAARMGVPIPKILLRLLQRLKADGEPPQDGAPLERM